MSSLDIITRKIYEIDNYIKTIKYIYGLVQKRKKLDVVLKGALERYLFLIMQSTIDLASAVISYENLRKPITYSEAFEVLVENDIINFNLSEKLIKMVGARNILVHEYTKFDLKLILNELPQNLKDIKCFTKRIKKFLML